MLVVPEFLFQASLSNVEDLVLSILGVTKYIETELIFVFLLSLAYYLVHLCRIEPS